MKVVVALPKSDNGSDDVVARRVAVIKWLVAEPVSQRVDTEGGLLHEEGSKDTSINESAEPVTPAEATDESGQDDGHEDNDLEIVLVLPDNDGILIQIGNIGTANSLGVLLHQHPAEMRVQETLADGIWIFFGVCVSVMGTMITGPPSDGTFDGAASDSSEEDSKRKGGRI